MVMFTAWVEMNDEGYPLLATAETWNMLPDGYQKRLRVTTLVTALHDTL